MPSWENMTRPGAVFGMELALVLAKRAQPSRPCRCVHLPSERRISLVATGRFLTILPASALRFPTKREDVKVLPIELTLPRMPVGIVTLRDRMLASIGRLFIEHARDGFESMLTELRERYPAIPVVVLSAQQDSDSIVSASTSGARCFVPTSGRREVTVSALQLVFAGGIYVPPEILARDEPSPR
jgi:hypothetical protein